MRFSGILAGSILFAGTLAVPAVSQTPVKTSVADTQAVGTAVRQFHEALAKGDSALVLRLLAEDAVILEAGNVETRAEYRAHHLAADIQQSVAVPAKYSPLKIQVVGDAAWVTSTAESVGTSNGRPVNSVIAELMVLSRSARGWQIHAIHWSSRRRAS